MRRRALLLGLGFALGSSSCSTDVSVPASFGSQGVILTGLPVGTPLTSLAGSDTGVYFTLSGNGFVLYCPNTGCGAAGWTTAAMVDNTVARVVVGDDGVPYFVELTANGTSVAEIASIPQSGVTQELYLATSTPVGSATSQLQPFLGADGGYVYWTDASESSLYACPSTGCLATPPTSLSLPANGTPRLVRGGFAYLTAIQGLGTELLSCPAPTTASTGAGTCTTLLPGSFDVQRIDVSGDQLYYEAAGATPGMFVCTLPSCTDSTLLFAGLGSVTLGVNATTLYSDIGNGFTTCALPGCPLGPHPVDFAFEPVELLGSDPPPSLVTTGSGAYAYAVYWPPSGSLNLELGKSIGLVYISPP